MVPHDALTSGRLSPSRANPLRGNRVCALASTEHLRAYQGSLEKEGAESFQRSTNAALDRQKRTLADQRILEAQLQQTAAKETAA
jgi:hypothetical protein